MHVQAASPRVPCDVQPDVSHARACGHARAEAVGPEVQRVVLSRAHRLMSETPRHLRRSVASSG